MLFEITEEEKEEAILYLMKNIPKDCLKKVFVLVQDKGHTWWILVHSNFGTYVRNTLREGGFHWGAIALDHLWVMLIEEAARRVESQEKNSLD